MRSTTGKTSQTPALGDTMAQDSHHDSSLDALFANSAGPVVSRLRSPGPASQGLTTVPAPHAAMKSKRPRVVHQDETKVQDEDDDAEENPDTDQSGHLISHVSNLTNPERIRTRKRRRAEESHDLEESYLKKLAANELREDTDLKRQNTTTNDEENVEDDDGEGPIPVHEALSSKADGAELERATRTVFLSNVSIEAITSKAAKKAVLAHLSKILDTAESIESIRFRSVAFSTSSLPKRAAYITKSLMEATTRSTNAYVVYSSAASARLAVASLNGTEILGRHLRVDSVAHPSPVDHHRCVFVGNLGFVDDETIVTPASGDGEPKVRHRSKVPSDVEEGLWRVFGAEGRKVENVRVVRDPQTRVGKGFAYVQFNSSNDVEFALLLNGKKFPPMLPRPLRVMRARNPRKTALALDRDRSKAAAVLASRPRPDSSTPEQRSLSGRAARLLGRSGAASIRQPAVTPQPTLRSPEEVVFEGRRASARDKLPSGLKFGTAKGRKSRRRVPHRGTASRRPSS